MNHGNLLPGTSLQPDHQRLHMATIQARHMRDQRLRRQQQASEDSKSSQGGRTLRNTRTKAKRALRAEDNDQFAFFDDLPIEITSKILSYLHVSNGKDPLFLRPEKSLDPAHASHYSIDTPVDMRTAYYNEHSDAQPPTEKHSSPDTNLLLVSRLFRDVGYKLFYHNNVFTFSDDDHVDDVLRRLDIQKRSFIRHVSFESQWALKLRLNPDMSGNIIADFDLDWGNYMTSALDHFPKITSITLRIRWTTHYRDFLLQFDDAFEWEQNHGKVLIEHDNGVLAFLETRDEMRAWVANKVEADYTALGMARFLPMIKLAFVWGNEDREWKGNESAWPLAEIERDPAQFGVDRLKERNRWFAWLEDRCRRRLLMVSSSTWTWLWSHGKDGRFFVGVLDWHKAEMETCSASLFLCFLLRPPRVTKGSRD